MIENYNSYHFSLKEFIRYLLQGMVIVIIIGELFYQSFIGMLILSPIIYFYLKEKKKTLIKLRKWKLNLEFKDGIASLSAALGAGYSAEHAFEEALKDLSLIYPKNSLIILEFSYILNQIRMNITVEKTLSSLGERSGIEDILSFAEVFTTAKRSGGDLIQVIRSTSSTISDKLEVKREILTMITAKKYEADMMKIIPLGMIGYLTVSSPGFLDPLYHNLLGVIIMTLLFIVYLGAYLAVEKIIAIEV